jgi:hypothetical protein
MPNSIYTGLFSAATSTIEKVNYKWQKVFTQQHLNAIKGKNIAGTIDIIVKEL